MNSIEAKNINFIHLCFTDSFSKGYWAQTFHSWKQLLKAKSAQEN